MAVLQDMTQSTESLMAEIARLKGENAALVRATTTSLKLKVSEKGALSIYGMGRFPVTLYREQWERLLSMADAIRQFIADNSDDLKRKGE